MENPINKHQKSAKGDTDGWAFPAFALDGNSDTQDAQNY
jgi:hypothetical protein